MNIGDQLSLFDDDFDCGQDDAQFRFRTYQASHCWQYQMRLDNLAEDLKALPPSIDYRDVTVRDFEFRPLNTKVDKDEAIAFIKRHEWLGTITQYTTNYFGAYYGNILCGVILFSMPNSFSKLLGDNTSEVERLISRGACISWSPKCLASTFMMWCIKWMVHNTQYRLFTAYSDPTAKELGTIYQACNFYYLGQKSGTTTRYINPYTGKIVSDRFFRQRSAYRKYAKELGITWDGSWEKSSSMNWDAVPNDIERKLREMSRNKQKSSEKIVFPSKHKYAYLLGETKLETARLRKKFLEMNKVYPYPKQRGS